MRPRVGPHTERRGGPADWYFARTTLGTLRAPQLRGIVKDGRLTVIYSKEDLSVGLVGQHVDIIGYDPQTATTLMSKVLVYSTGTKSASATTKSK